MTEQKVQEVLSLDNLKDHCERQCLRYKDSQLGYEHYIFLCLLRNAYERDIEDYITDYYLIMEGELEL
jgi:hypothetical protein